MLVLNYGAQHFNNSFLIHFEFINLFMQNPQINQWNYKMLERVTKFEKYDLILRVSSRNNQDTF